MSTKINKELRKLDEDVALRAIIKGTATETGEQFMRALVKHLCKALQTHGAWVTEYLEDTRRLRALAFYLGNDWVDEYEYDIKGTPCEPVLERGCLVHFPENVVELYPKDPDLKPLGAVSYMGVPFIDTDGKILGHLAVLDNRPLHPEPRILALFHIFADRAAAELKRLRAEAEIRARKEQLHGLVNSAMDAILQLDEQLRIELVNDAAENVFGCEVDVLVGQPFKQFLAPQDHVKFANLIRTLHSSTKNRQLWIPGGLNALRDNSEAFAAEATLSRFDLDGKTSFTLILRDLNERLEAEQKIRSLTAETEYLREEIRTLKNFDEIIGESEALLKVLRDVNQVANTEATVLIIGETGTGKERIARAIHRASNRKDKVMITVNCAAIPHSLIESEFFGHEKGAFTGATARREGRFALAHGGTIFLDEIGELPLDLQAKLLRILQEGEFTPVGGSGTRTVDVRVISATNRDLKAACNEGTFREDLFYRLNVFPIHLPPLRQRGQDVVLLANAFAHQFANRMGCTIQPISTETAQRLQKYEWPGNVRELQNVIERAVITSRDGVLNLDQALPANSSSTEAAFIIPQNGDCRYLTSSEFRDFERENILRALKAAKGRVSGKNGAAHRLGMNQSTLYSRIKALGIE